MLILRTRSHDPAVISGVVHWAKGLVISTFIGGNTFFKLLCSMCALMLKHIEDVMRHKNKTVASLVIFPVYTSHRSISNWLKHLKFSCSIQNKIDHFLISEGLLNRIVICFFHSDLLTLLILDLSK